MADQDAPVDPLARRPDVSGTLTLTLSRSPHLTSPVVVAGEGQRRAGEGQKGEWLEEELRWTLK